MSVFYIFKNQKASFIKKAKTAVIIDNFVFKSPFLGVNFRYTVI